MRIVRFTRAEEISYGILEDEQVYGLAEDPFTCFAAGKDPARNSRSYKLAEVRLLAPCLPSKIACVGVNYRAHATEMGSSTPPAPLIFLKPSTALIGPGDKIMMPLNWKRVDFEGELGVVIGKKARYVPEEEAGQYILGYTCFNDVTERQLQKEDGQWTRAKGFDTFAPAGPWIETGTDSVIGFGPDSDASFSPIIGFGPDSNASFSPIIGFGSDLKLETYLNGELRQSARTSEMVHGIARLISFISGVMTLLPGDIIATGTPSGIAPMQPGDVVEVRIEKIGALRNPVYQLVGI